MQELPKDRAELLDLLDGLIATRLLQKATKQMSPAGPQPEEKENQQTADLIPLTPEDATDFLPVEFAKVEKNLVSLGFFTPSSKRIKDAKAKTISINTTVQGNRIEAKATIAPAALYGLPITADQDKYLALQKLITDLRQRQGGEVTNPVSFSSAELLHLLDQGDAGKNYREIDEWLNVMASTTIISEGAVYLAGKKRFVKDRFHVFDRAVSFGKEIEPGIIADKNYVWFSSWQLENINNNYLIPVDLETYRQLRNHIAKTLVPLLQIWLFASRKEGSFEKRYDELCQILSIRQYQYRSRVKEQLGPSLNELQHHGYLASWDVEETSNGKEYKLIFRHGEKFHRDRRRRLAAKTASEPAALDITGSSNPPTTEIATVAQTPPRPRQAHLHLKPEIDNKLLAELTRRGVGESGARKLLAKLPPDRPVRDLLEWGDQEIARQPGKIHTPAGFYIRLLEEHSAPPPTFESSRQAKARLEAENKRQEAIQQQRETALREEEAGRQKLDDQIGTLPPEHRRALQTQAETDFYTTHPKLKAIAKAHPGSAIHEGSIRSRMRELITHGWKFVTPLAQGSAASFSADLESILTTPQLQASVKQKNVSSGPPTTSTIVESDPQ